MARKDLRQADIVIRRHHCSCMLLLVLQYIADRLEGVMHQTIDDTQAGVGLQQKLDGIHIT